MGGYKATEVESRESEQSFDFWVGLVTNLFFRQTVQVALLSLRRCTNELSQHLERRTEPQVLDSLAQQNLRRFKLRYVLLRQYLKANLHRSAFLLFSASLRRAFYAANSLPLNHNARGSIGDKSESESHLMGLPIS